MNFFAEISQGTRPFKIRWVLFGSIAFVIGLALFLLRGLVFQSFSDHVIESRISEVIYSTETLSSRSSFDAPEGADPAELSKALLERIDISSITRDNEDIRVLLLDSKGVVVQDSSDGSSVGNMVLSEESVQNILSTVSEMGADGMERIVTPILNTQGTKVQGMLYIFLDTRVTIQGLRHVRLYVWLMMFIVLTVAAGLVFLLVYFLERPLDTIINWLKTMKAGKEEEKIPEVPQLRVKSEYTTIIGSVADITRDLLAVDRSRKEFVSNVSHELKTPLSSIKVLTEALLLQESVPESTYKEFLQDINNEIDRMNGIVSDLLTLVRLDEGQSALNLSKLSLDGIVEDILKRLKPLADPRQVELLTEVIKPVEMEADETKLTIALTNLIQNGIKYNRDGGQVKVRIDSNSQYALIVISDTGIGIEESHFDKLFQRFYRVDKSRDRVAGGSGLGLSIVRQVIALHKGTISVSSVVGEGTSFSIKLPLAQNITDEAETD